MIEPLATLLVVTLALPMFRQNGGGAQLGPSEPYLDPSGNAYTDPADEVYTSP
jgi:hypothetical protein